MVKRVNPAEMVSVDLPVETWKHILIALHNNARVRQEQFDKGNFISVHLVARDEEARKTIEEAIRR